MAGKFVDTLHFVEVRSKAAAAKLYKIAIVSDDKITIKFTRFHHNQRHFIVAENPTVIEQISEAEYDELNKQNAPIAIKVGNTIKFIEYTNNFTIQFLEREQIPYEKLTSADININNNCVYTIAQLENVTGVQLSKTVLGEDVRRYVARDSNRFDMYIEAGWSIHEIIDGSKPSRFILDIDLKREYNGYLQCALNARDFIYGDRYEANEEGTDFIDTVKGCADLVINRYCIQAGAADECAEYGYETEAKISRHIIYPNVICENGRTNKTIVKEIAEEVKKTVAEAFEYKREEYGPDDDDYKGNEGLLMHFITSILDPVGSNGYWHMRLPNCSKNGDFARTIKPLNNTCKRYGKFMGVGAPFDNPNMSHPECEQYEKFNAISDSTIKRVGGLLNKYFPGSFTINTAGKLSRSGRFMCTTCQKEHATSGVFISTFRNVTKVICYRNFQKLKQYNCIIRANQLYNGELEYSEVIGNPINIVPILDDISKLENATIVNGARCTDAIDDDFNSSYIISSVWGTGKSYFIARAIEDAKARGLKIICISSRISLSYQQVKAWGLTNYSDIKGFLNLAKPEHAATNWQIEALAARVNPDECAGALIVVDEITALAHHCASDNNDSGNIGYLRRMGLNILAHLLNSCARYIVSDNDINNIQINALVKACPRIIPKIFDNTYSKYDKSTARIYTHKNAMQLADNAISDRIKKNYEDYKAGKRIFPICVSHHHKRSINGIVEKFKQYASPEDFHLLAHYTSDTATDIKQADYSDATTAWAGKIAIIYSPTISIGISAELADIHEVYGVFDGSLISAQQSAQSLFRCRQADVFHIYLDHSANPCDISAINFNSKEDPAYVDGFNVLDGDNGAPLFNGIYPETMTDYMDWVDRSKVPRDIGYNYMHYFNPFKTRADAEQYLMGSFVGSLFVSAKLQIYRSKNNFYRELVHILERARFSIVNAQIDINQVCETVTDDNGAPIKKPLDMNQSVKKLVSFVEGCKKNAGKVTATKLAEIIDAKAIPTEGTPEFALYKNMLFMLDYMGVPFAEIEKMNYDTMSDLIKYYDDIKRANKMLGSCKYAKTGNQVQAGGINTMTKTDAEIYPNIGAMLNDLGITDLEKFYATKGTITLPIDEVETYADNSHHINYFMENSARLFGRSTRSATKTAFAKTLFERVGITFKVEGKGGHKNRATHYLFSFVAGLGDIEQSKYVKLIRSSSDA